MICCSVCLGFQSLIEVIDGALPGEFGGGFVVTRRRVVVESVKGLGINISFILDAIGLKCGFVSGPSAGGIWIFSRSAKCASTAALIFGTSAAAGALP